MSYSYSYMVHEEPRIQKEPQNPELQEAEAAQKSIAKLQQLYSVVEDGRFTKGHEDGEMILKQINGSSTSFITQAVRSIISPRRKAKY